jgi:hypothetical protein
MVRPVFGEQPSRAPAHVMNNNRKATRSTQEKRDTTGTFLSGLLKKVAVCGITEPHREASPFALVKARIEPCSWLESG